MCGIIGIIGSKDLAGELYRALLNLQHRGQDAAGILSYAPEHSQSESGVNRIRQLGLAENLENELVEIHGEMGIGQVRYPTIGKGTLNDAQPLYVTGPNGIIAIVHNGNLLNYPILRRELEQSGSDVYTNSDVEIILNVLNSPFSPQKTITENLVDAVKRVYNRVIGAYSVVCFSKKLSGIIAFRDPQGIKPLLYGERTVDGKPSYGFASENDALHALKFRNIRSLDPGVVVIVDKERHLSFHALRQGKHAHCIFEWIYFSSPESVLEGISVYAARKSAGELLGLQLCRDGLTNVDVVVPVPDTARTAAQSLAEVLNVPFEEGLIKNRYIGRTFIMPNQIERENAVGVKLKPVREVLAEKSVLLVDDSIVRGTTSKKIVHMVREAGARKVYFASTFPPITHPCYYGIDFQRGNELIARNKSIEEIRQLIEADELFFITPESLREAVGLEDVCMACATGKYPTEIGAAGELEKMRNEQKPTQFL